MKKALKILTPLVILTVMMSQSMLDVGIPAFFDDLSAILDVNTTVLISLISACSLGITIGILWFSPKINRNTFYHYSKFLIVLSVIAGVSFSFYPKMEIMLISRFTLGLVIGLVSSFAWWYSFNVSTYTSTMHMLIMMIRPLSVALGVLVLFFLNKYLAWENIYFLFSVCPVAFFLIWSKFSHTTEDRRRSQNLVEVYKSIFAHLRGNIFYITVLLNAMGYLGYYVVIPFWEVNVFSLEEAFLFFGIVEIIGTFMSRYINMVTISLVRFVIALLAFAPLGLMIYQDSLITVILLTVYILAVRIYILHLANSIPQVFSYLDNKDKFGFCGSLIGVFAWIGLGVISLLATFIFEHYNLTHIYFILFLCNVFSLLLYNFLKVDKNNEGLSIA